MERKKRSKGRGWESCYVKKFYGTFGVEMRAYGQKLVQFRKHTRVSYSSIDIRPGAIPNPESESKDESESESGFDSGFGFMCSGIGFGVGIV